MKANFRSLPERSITTSHHAPNDPVIEVRLQHRYHLRTLHGTILGALESELSLSFSSKIILVFRYVGKTELLTSIIQRKKHLLRVVPRWQRRRDAIWNNGFLLAWQSYSYRPAERYLKFTKMSIHLPGPAPRGGSLVGPGEHGHLTHASRSKCTSPPTERVAQTSTPPDPQFKNTSQRHNLSSGMTPRQIFRV